MGSDRFSLRFVELEYVIRYRDVEGPVSEAAVLRAWIARETRKPGYRTVDPATVPDEWVGTVLAAEFDEPVDAAMRGDPTWYVLTVDGAAMGEFAAFPASGWDTLSKEGTIGDAVDRLVGEDLEDAYPDAIESIREFRGLYPEQSFGGVLARQFDDGWPPVMLDGNHRACAVHWLAREGIEVEVDVYLGVVDPWSTLPLAPRATTDS